MLKAERKERTHRAILESAAKMIRAKGIGGARIADVMAGCGLTVGGFYAHWDTKESLVDDALRITAARLRKMLFDRLETKPEKDRAEVVLKRYLSTAHRDDLESGCPFPAVIGEIATWAPEHREVLAEQVDETAGELQTLLDGEGRRQLALALIALMVGGLSLARALNGTQLSDDMLKACRAVGRTLLNQEKKK